MLAARIVASVLVGGPGPGSQPCQRDDEGLGHDTHGEGGITMFIPRMRAVARWSTLGLLVPTLPTAAGQINHPDLLRNAGIPPGWGSSLAARLIQ